MNGDFDEQRLNEALKRYGEAEPRPGLESRILRILAAERERSVGRGWHWRLAAATLAFGIIAVVGFLLARKPDPPRLNVVTGAPITNPGQGKAPARPSDHKTVVALRPNKQGKSQRHVAVAKARTEPRLEQFPSPIPLTEQEQMLARYVRERPQEAVMVARARAELLRAELLRFQQPQESKEEDSER